jgi:hypothetical protein
MCSTGLTSPHSRSKTATAPRATFQFESSILKGAPSTLRPEQREIVVLAYFGGLTHPEISNKLAQPLGTVKTRMRLALKKLRDFHGGLDGIRSGCYYTRGALCRDQGHKSPCSPSGGEPLAGRDQCTQRRLLNLGVNYALRAYAWVPACGRVVRARSFRFSLTAK